MAKYSKEQLRSIFQSRFNREAWKTIVVDIFGADKVRRENECFTDANDPETGYFMGTIDTPDSYHIGLFYYKINSGSVAHKKVGLRNLVKSFINRTWGEFDAAIVVFDDSTDWRLSFICDIKEEATAPKRFTYVFGEDDNLYRTPIERFTQLQNQEPTFENIRKAFSVEALSDDFFVTYRDLYADFVQYITGKKYVKEKGKWVEKTLSVPNYQFTTEFDNNEKNVRDYIKKMFGRIVFLYFLQRKGWLDNNHQYMHQLFEHSQQKDNFLEAVLEPLFFEILNTDKRYRTINAQSLPGSSNIPYLNGGLFAKDHLDEKTCVFPAEYFHRLFTFLDSYNFTIDENDSDDAVIGIDPEMLGRIFENLLEDNKDKGAFYTPKEIVSYMCRESLIAYLRTDDNIVSEEEIRNLIYNNDGEHLTLQQRKYIKDRLKTVKICDPAIGSGAFPMGLVNILSKIYHSLKLSTDMTHIKRHIMEQNIYGVDIEKGAVDIARLRFWLAMIVDEKDPVPLPNLHFKIMQGNSLLENYKGFDLSDLTKVGVIKNIFFESDDFVKKSLVEDLKAYYATSDHRKRDQLLNDIINNVRSQLFAKGISEEIISEIKDPSANSDFFLWHTWFSDVFADGGFDIVIGNPPYIQLQNNGGGLAKLYQGCNFKSFARTGDIYALFYEQGWRLLKDKGILCYITSNKWMRAGYGESLRGFFAKYTNPLLLLDFGGIQIFDNATVDTNILLFSKEENQHKTIAVSGSKQDKSILNNLSDFVKQSGVITGFGTDDSWVILSPIEQSIKRKIEAVGTPLKDWDIQINYGIKTGCNEAFIISTEKRDEILANCADEDERRRTEEIIRPILRGRDIKRYGYDWAGLYLIWIPWHFPFHLDPSIKGASVKAEDAFKSQYPAVYDHLYQFKEQLSARNKAETGIRYEWYALQRWGANYWEDFFSPKIIFQEIVQESQFCLDDSTNFMCNDTCRIIVGDDLDYLLKILNSKLFFYSVKTFYGGGKLGESGVRMKHTFFLDFPCIRYDGKVTELTDFDKFLFNIYNLSQDEIRYIELN